MALRLPCAGGLAALLAAAAALPVCAKPPDLPLDPNVTCAAPAPPNPAAPVAGTEPGPTVPDGGTILIGGFKPLAATVAEPLAVLPAEVEELTVMPAEVEAPEVAPMPTPIKESAAPTMSCPYLNEQNLSIYPHPIHCEPAPQLATPLDNLKKLEDARRLLERAERLRERGRLEKACGCYEKVTELCPGTRFAARAAACLRECVRGALAQTGADGPGRAECEERQTTGYAPPSCEMPIALPPPPPPPPPFGVRVILVPSAPLLPPVPPIDGTHLLRFWMGSLPPGIPLPPPPTMSAPRLAPPPMMMNGPMPAPRAYYAEPIAPPRPVAYTPGAQTALGAPASVAVSPPAAPSDDAMQMLHRLTGLDLSQKSGEMRMSCRWEDGTVLSIHRTADGHVHWRLSGDN